MSTTLAGKNWLYMHDQIITRDHMIDDLRGYLHETIKAYEKLASDETKLCALYEKSLDDRDQWADRWHHAHFENENLQHDLNARFWLTDVT